MLVLSSPSGAGKTTISRRLLELEPGLKMSVSATTRPKRTGATAGREYQFVDNTETGLMVTRGDLLEHAQVFGHYYGTPRTAVSATQEAGCAELMSTKRQGTNKRQA